MNLFSRNFIKCHQSKLLFIVVWAHVTILDLFYVSSAGPVFLFQENIQPYTLFIHFMVASLTLALYFLLNNISIRYRLTKVAQLHNTTKGTAL